ncbi:uncharacterized protein Z518_03168 [Rhinocladiella mackenziei CBS 650.93]|uniref:Acetyl-CoA synthetase-like protein n=1 Tax=Rhinocladiella mackenziei CBS 650.93 TaxID=1442369 RepID=A0A0D2G223_9EURO|nr:uncharacterized protein Z518_03168 [Rhinocladiella mackenziei CBS 650.93]KIX08512.1 hypothetical protein Z518_03168 [Rhinocladiella mackenziei CBS 650.93]
MPYLAEEHYPIPTIDLLTWMFDHHAPYDEDKPIYIDAANPSRSISCQQARSIVRRLAAGFKKAGLKKSDCVCLMAFNDICYSMAFLGIIAAGGVFTGVNPSYTVFELIHAIRTADITYLIVEPDLVPKVLRAAKECSIPASNIFAFDILGQANPQGLAVKSWDVLQVEGEEIDWERFDEQKQSEETVVARLFSSGTTGLPKALDISVWNFISQHTLVMEVRPRPYEVRRLLSNPLFHVSQVPRAHTSAIKSGAATFVMRRFELEPWLSNIAKYNITEVNIVPMMVISLLSSGLLDSGKYSLKTLRNAWAGSAPLDKGVQARFKEYLRPDTPFNQAWGMSETTCLATMFYFPEQDFTGSVGRFIPNCDAKIVDEEGNDISGIKGTNGLDVRGELCVRGPIIVKGYYRNDEANQRDWDEDGYFHTGDIAYCDSKTRKWYIVDRKKELIKVRGFQVAPTELEGVLLLHPNIVDCAVVGVHCSVDKSELPRAYIVVKPGTVLTEAEVREFTRDKLARYKQLDGGIRFVDKVPRNANGKIQKTELRQMVKQEMSARL